MLQSATLQSLLSAKRLCIANPACGCTGSEQPLTSTSEVSGPGLNVRKGRAFRAAGQS